MSVSDEKKGMAPRRKWFRFHYVFIALGSLYAFAVIIALAPITQKYVLYAHHIDSIGYTEFDKPERYGLAPGKAVNLQLKSSDNTTLGAWFIFSDPFYRSLPYPPSPTPQSQSKLSSQIPNAIQRSPTILFLHGNTGTRALHLRIAIYAALTAKLGANVLAIDYRGFADSEGEPTVDGVGKDARAGWDFLVTQGGADPMDVLVVGHSLGTAVAGRLAAELGREGTDYRGLVLMSPFSSVRALIDHYYLFGCLPLLKPLSMIPFAPRLVTWSLTHNFDTLTLVPDMKSSVLIVHAEDDWDIPHTHSSILFDAFLNLPADPIATGKHALHDLNHSHQQAPMQGLNLDGNKYENVTHTTIPEFGALQQVILPRNPSSLSSGSIGNVKEGDGKMRKVAMLKTLRGGHDIGKLEGVQDVIGRLFGFYAIEDI